MTHPPLPSIWILASAIFFALFFLLMPDLDLYVSGMFYRQEGGFMLLGNDFFDLLHKEMGIFVGMQLIGVAAVILWSRYTKKPDAWRGRRLAAVHLLLVLVLGSGVLVNEVFKNSWGRARPAQVQEFGGAADFTPAWIVTDQCEKNCSFVCGDASVGFVLLAPAFFSRRRYLWLAAGTLVGGGLGLMRVAQGGHFFSDVIFSFYVVYFTAWGVWYAMKRYAPT